MDVAPTPPKRLSYTNVVSKEATQDSLVSSGQLSRHGDVICIKIDEAAYQRRINLCHNSLIGRITVLKGDKPWTFDGILEAGQGLENDFSWQF